MADLMVSEVIIYLMLIINVINDAIFFIIFVKCFLRKNLLKEKNKKTMDLFLKSAYTAVKL